VFNTLGAVVLQRGKLDEAVSFFNRALQINLDYAEAHANLGYTLSLQGKFDDAYEHLTEAIRLNPKIASGHFNLANVLLHKGKTAEAIIQFEEALSLEPGSVQCMNDLAWLLATTSKTELCDPNRAIMLSEKACELTNYKKPELLDTLAAGYAAGGNYSKAVETAEKALELCKPSQEKLKKEIILRLDLYKKKKPYIENP
jgi:tetratricopeptide (TPR) repeat protein